MKHYCKICDRELRPGYVPPIEVKHSQKTGGGFYSSYFKLNNKMGVKLLGGYTTYEDATESCHWNDAKQEGYLLDKAYPLRLSPKFLDIKVVKFNGKYSIGIFMEHIKGETFEYSKKVRKISKKFKGKSYYDSNGRYIFEQRIKEAIKKRYKSIGINRGDLHAGNMMIDNTLDITISYFELLCQQLGRVSFALLLVDNRGDVE